MKQSLHALVVDVERGRALAATYGSKWLLPITTCDERVRPLPIVARSLADSGIPGDVAGQWLGRVTGESIDWLVVIGAVAPDIHSELEWQPLDLLASSPPVLEYQHWALARTLRRRPLPSVDGAFGNVCWPQDVRRWISAVFDAPVDSLTPYRCGAHEVVVGAQCGPARVFFKGLAQDRVHEVWTTRALAAIEPESFARTIAVARRRDGCTWWLTAECAGRASGDLHCVPEALARIQQRVLETNPDRLPLQRIDLDAAERWASDLLGDSPHRDVVVRACARLRGADVPVTWIPMDLDPANVLIDDGQPRFIDVDDSFLGPAPLAMATVAMRGTDRTLYRAYQRAWPAARGLDWRTFETVATVIHAWLGWTRLERNVDRGEVFVDRDFASSRTRARPSRAIDAPSPWPVRPAGPAACIEAPSPTDVRLRRVPARRLSTR